MIDFVIELVFLHSTVSIFPHLTYHLCQMYRPRLFDRAFSIPRTQDPRNLPRVRSRKLDQYPTGLQATAMSQLCGDISFEVTNTFSRPVRLSRLWRSWSGVLCGVSIGSPGRCLVLSVSRTRTQPIEKERQERIRSVVWSTRLCDPLIHQSC